MNSFITHVHLVTRLACTPTLCSFAPAHLLCLPRVYISPACSSPASFCVVLPPHLLGPCNRGRLLLTLLGPCNKGHFSTVEAFLSAQHIRLVCQPIMYSSPAPTSCVSPS